MRLTVRRVLEIVALYPDARLCREGVFRRGSLFQSARPAWGATMLYEFFCNFHVCFNPRAPRGARLYVSEYGFHAAEFQSARPAWGATSVRCVGGNILIVSIRAPRVGRDAW